MVQKTTVSDNMKQGAFTYKLLNLIWFSVGTY